MATLPSIRHYTGTPTLGYNEMLFTHTGLSYTLESSLFLDIMGCNYTTRNTSRYITLNYNNESLQRIVIRFLPYSHNIKLRNPIRLSSKAKLRSQVDIRSYDVSFSQTQNKQQVRVTYYKDPVDYNLDPRDGVANTVYTTAYNGDLVSTVTIADPTAQVIRVGYTEATGDTPRTESIQRVVGRLPSYRAYIYEVTSQLLNPDSEEAFNNQKVSACKILLPEITDGYIPASRVGHDMHNKSPMDIAWVLLYAIGANRPLHVLMVLKGLVAEGIRREIVIKDDAGGYKVNPDGVWGFEPMFKPRAESKNSSRDIGDNAFLGWALCRAVLYLQNRAPISDWSLDGDYKEFKLILEELLLAQGYLCAYSISRQYWWSCSFAEGLAYNYSVLSLRASYLTSIFLDSLLQIKYNYFIHQQAARLYLSLASIQDNTLGARSFSDFTDTANEIVAYRGLWFLTVSRDYSYAYDYISNNYNPEENSSLNAIPVYCLTILKEKLGITDALPDWVNAYIGDNQEAALGRFLSVTKTARHFLPVYLTLHKIDITNAHNFQLYALEASAQTTYTLSELRRLWPTGYRWASSSVINSVNTVLGSMFNADANLYFDYFLLKELTIDARSLSNSQAGFIRDWFEELTTIPTNTLLASDSFYRSLLLSYIGRNCNDRESIATLLRDTLGYIDSTISNPEPKPYSLVRDINRASDSVFDFTDEVTKLGQVDYLNQNQTSSIVYRPAQEHLISEDVTDCTSSNRITSYGGRLLRKVPGFPYKNVPVSDSAVNASHSIPVNREYTDVGTIKRLMYEPTSNISTDRIDLSYYEWVNDDLYVLEGSALVKVLSQYVPKLVIELHRVAAAYLSQFLQSTVTAGVKLEMKASNYYRDYLNTFYVYLASTGKWRIDNINLFSNVDYDNDSA